MPFSPDEDTNERLSFRDTFRDLGIPSISSLLSISTKYEFNDIRAEVIQYLTSLFPKSLKAFEDSETKRGTLDPNHLFDLLVVAHECNAISILPVLYFLCARLPLEKTVEALQSLPQDIAKNLLLGRDWLCDVSQLYIKLSFQTLQTGGKQQLERKTCGAPFCLEEFLEQHLKEFPVGQPERRFIFLFDIPDRGVLRGLDMTLSGICKSCEERYVSVLRGMKETGWDLLPQKFQGRTWEELGEFVTRCC